MTIEQKPELNRYVDPFIPLTWQARWRFFKFLLPPLCFSLACLIEMGLLKAWLADRLNWEFAATLTTCCLVLPLFLLGMQEIQLRLRHRSKRKLILADKKITLKPAKMPGFAWDKIQAFRFEPLAQTGNLTKLTVFLRDVPNKANRRQGSWSMVLERGSQEQVLIHYLEQRKLEGINHYEIEQMRSPASMAQVHLPSIAGMAVSMVGLFLLMHGGPLLLALSHHGNHQPSENAKFTQQELAKLGRFIAEHFASQEEFRRFSLGLGLSLTFVGLGMLVFGWRLMKRERDASVS